MGISPSSLIEDERRRCNDYPREKQRRRKGRLITKQPIRIDHPHRSRLSEILEEAEMIPDGLDAEEALSAARDPSRFAASRSASHEASDHLIAPKRPVLSAKEIPELKELHREMVFNNKMGINVLGQKSELKKAMEKMHEQVVRRREDEERRRNRSDLELELEKRAVRLAEIENLLLAEQRGHLPATVNDEFHRIHAKVNGRFASATS